MNLEPKELKETADISAGESDWTDKLKLLLSACGIFIGLYAIAVGAAQVAINFFPDSIETALGKVLAENFPEGESEDPSFKKAKAIFDKFIASGLERDLPYRLCYMDKEMVNAFALPGGTICVTKGLVDNIQSEIGLAMVIGHEFGHHQKKHILQRLSSILILQSLVALTTGYGLEGLSGNLMNAYFLSNSRDHEYEADAYGVQLVEKVYQSTEGVLEFYQYAEELQGTSRASKIQTWMETHPHMSSRIERIKKIQSQ